jgi:antitoxin component of MazEF toxin-antitoxin module
MKRKLIKQRDSYTVTLPIKWVGEKGLKPGDEIDVEIDNGKVVIDSETHPELKSVEIEITDNSILRSVIGVAYRAGYNKITINLKKTINLAELQKVLNFFTGLEVETINSKKFTLRCIIPVSREEYGFFVKKIFLTNKLMIDEIIKFLNGNSLNFHDIDEMRKTNLKAREYCMRAINIEKIGKKEECDEYTFIHIIEKISGSLWHMGQYIDNNKVARSDKLKELLLSLKKLIDRSYHIYLKKDYKSGMHEVLADRFKLRNEWFKQDKLFKIFKSKGNDPVLLSLILDIRTRISDAMSRHLSTIIES